MEALNITADNCSRCLEILKSATEPIVAAEIARQLGLGGCRETQRREVRAIVTYLREQGSMIVASTIEGYWLTEDKDIWKDYQEKRAIDGKRIIAEASKRKKEIGDNNGQGFLFMPGNPIVGYA
jgi:biotin operon repressor